MVSEPGRSTLPAAAKGENALSLRDFFEAIRRRTWIILLVAFVCAGSTIGFELLQTPAYDASIKILVGQERVTDRNAPWQGAQELQQVTRTMTEGVESRTVAEEVIQRLGLQMTSEEFLNKQTAKQIGETQFIQVDYRDSSPQRAQQVANSIGDALSQQVSQVSASASALTATVWERAEVPDEPASPRPLRDGALALVFGLMLGVGLALILEYLDDSWRSPEEAELVTGVPIFGVVPEFKAFSAKKKGQEEKGARLG